eukprot:319489-Chlamydomonas_euryale.AAC.1
MVGTTAVQVCRNFKAQLPRNLKAQLLPAAQPQSHHHRNSSTHAASASNRSNVATAARMQLQVGLPVLRLRRRERRRRVSCPQTVRAELRRLQCQPAAQQRRQGYEAGRCGQAGCGWMGCGREVALSRCSLAGQCTGRGKCGGAVTLGICPSCHLFQCRERTRRHAARGTTALLRVGRAGRLASVGDPPPAHTHLQLLRRDGHAALECRQLLRVAFDVIPERR